jgi:preprotein translocase subunit SecG
MFSVLMTLEVMVSVLLILVVLMQSAKGGGLAGTFGGSNVGMVFGVRRTADFLINATQILAIAFGVLALVINLFFLPRLSEGGAESAIQRSSSTQGTVAPQLPPAQSPDQSAPISPAPAQPGGGQP